jgi:hypothetical protein
MRTFEVGDVVGRDEQVGVATGTEGHAGLTVLTLPGTGVRRIWEWIPAATQDVGTAPGHLSAPSTTDAPGRSRGT